MKIVFIISFLILYTFSETSFAEKKYISKIVSNFKNELKCPIKFDKIEIRQQIKDNKMEIVNFINRSINKDNKLPINQIMNFVIEYRKGGALINIGSINDKLSNNENQTELINNFSSNRRNNVRGWGIKLLSINF